ncbi:hypothetical protein P171DRAFT_238489 [Karstenula rhodostoma CBS 690.94]|uniref:Uncharacterized protein n=1 Tax=Karstenula rhodostoma CBS 690.94 TaxID=1392251 RepID=A0A9P4PMN0_9PLEO|nr:hypothetical protein P171DRAFT_238489 [Karstenula rhodostoma CBS 690.94]
MLLVDVLHLPSTPCLTHLHKIAQATHKPQRRRWPSTTKEVIGLTPPLTPPSQCQGSTRRDNCVDHACPGKPFRGTRHASLGRPLRGPKPARLSRLFKDTRPCRKQSTHWW